MNIFYVTNSCSFKMMGEPDSDKPSSQLLKRRKTGSNILRRLSLTGNKKR